MKYYVNKNIYHNGKGIKGGEIFDPVDVGYDENDIKYLLNQFKIRPFDETIKKVEVVETVKKEEVKIVEEIKEIESEIEEVTEYVVLEDPIDFNTVSEESFDEVEHAEAVDETPVVEIKKKRNKKSKK